MDEVAPTETVVEPAATPTPELGTQTPVAEKPEVKPEAKVDEKPKTNSDALKAASERLKAKAEAEAKAKAEPKPETK